MLVDDLFKSDKKEEEKPKQDKPALAQSNPPANSVKAEPKVDLKKEQPQGETEKHMFDHKEAVA